MTNKLEDEFQLSADEILHVIDRSPRCKQMVKGFVAEYHLERLFQGLKDSGKIVSFERLNRDGQPDFVVKSNKGSFRVECKMAMAKTRYADGDMKIDFQRTRNSPADPTSRFYKRGDFDIVAACLYNQTGKWEFKFIRTSNLLIDQKVGKDCLMKALRYPGGLPWVNSIESLILRKR